VRNALAWTHEAPKLLAVYDAVFDPAGATAEAAAARSR
jgi:hypothetical protein